ncbi:WD40 repeat-like protein, partial [Ramicandelaber brevisporus]
MRVKVQQINWHDKQAILSVDFDHHLERQSAAEPNGTPQIRFATAGGDFNVRIWRLPNSGQATPARPSTEQSQVQYCATLSRHAAAVNVVRFSPISSILASAGDDGTIIMWKDTQQGQSLMGDDNGDSEIWKAVSMLRGSRADIYDIAWSPDGRFLISGSIDNTARIWDARTARCLHVLTDHSHYVQGVGWDPIQDGRYIVTQGSDRAVCVYEWDQPTATTAVTDEQQPPQPTSHPATIRGFMMYYDENLSSFFRRPAFLPDGSALLTAAGVYRSQQTPAVSPRPTTLTTNTVYAYARNRITSDPIAHFPGHKYPVTSIRPCPVLFEHRQADAKGLFTLPYRMVVATASIDTVTIYDTGSSCSKDGSAGRAIAVLGGLHYRSLSDMAWSLYGKYFVLSSLDGFCSLAEFEPNELGKPY